MTEEMVRCLRHVCRRMPLPFEKVRFLVLAKAEWQAILACCKLAKDAASGQTVVTEFVRRNGASPAAHLPENAASL